MTAFDCTQRPGLCEVSRFNTGNNIISIVGVDYRS